MTDEERNPLITSTYGVGEIILDALDHHVTKIILGGGSATNDGGSGMLCALGLNFLILKSTFKTRWRLLYLASKIDISNLDQRLKHVTFEVACDVTNPLLGANGATEIYGPQKVLTLR